MKDEKKMVKDFLNIYRNTVGIAMDNLKLKSETEDSVGYKNTSDSVGKFIYYWTTYMTMMHNILYYFIYQINIEYKDDIEELENRVKENTMANPLFGVNFRLFNIIYDEYTDKVDGAIIVRCLDKSEVRDINNPSAIADTMNLVYNIEYNDYNKYMAYSLEVCMDHGEYVKKPTVINIGTLDLKANTKDELLSIIRSSYIATNFLTLAIVNMVISGIEKKEFPFSLLCSAANRLGSTEYYLKSFDSDSLSKLIYTSIKDKDYPGRVEFLEKNENYRPHFDSIRYGEIAYNADTLLKDECEQYWLEKKKDSFLCVFKEINNKPYREIFLPYRGQVFENICRYKLFDNLNSLNNNGIYNLKIELAAIKDRGNVNQLSYIKQMVEELRRRQLYFTSHMSKTLLEELISSMDGYYEYMTKATKD